VNAWNELNPDEWICECGAKLDELSSKWRCAGSYWEHYHGYPIGHVPVLRKKTTVADLSLTETLATLGITHRRAENADQTGEHILEKDGVVIGRFTAHEAWQWLKDGPKEKSTSLTEDERGFVAHWTMFGTYAVVHKLGSKGGKWIVRYATCEHPGIFKTKREAGEAADKLACAIGLRKYEEDKELGV
jgi:hypothetical protein